MRKNKKQKKLLLATLLSLCLFIPDGLTPAASDHSIEWLFRSPLAFGERKSSLPAAAFSTKAETKSQEETMTEISTEPETMTESQTETTLKIETETMSETETEIETEFLPLAGDPLHSELSSYRIKEILSSITLSNYQFDLTEDSLAWQQLETELTSLINSYSGKWSLYLKDLSTGETININEQAQESASLIKLYVMGAVMQDIFDGKLEMNDTIQRLLENMITVSDNSATNDLVSYLDPNRNHQAGLERLNAFIDAQRFEDTHEYNGLNDSSLWYSPGSQNTTSAQDCGDLLERIYRGEFVSHLSSRSMEDLLLAQQITYKIPDTIPSESTVANKTGETSDCENDAAIVYTPNGDYILCIMSCEIPSKSKAVTQLHELSSLIYDYFINK